MKQEFKLHVDHLTLQPLMFFNILTDHSLKLCLLVRQYGDKTNLCAPEINAKRQKSDYFVELKDSAMFSKYLAETV
jgi:hypothetical protein